MGYDNLIKQLEDINSSILIPKDKLDKFYSWIICHSGYLLAEQNEFVVSEDKIPNVLSEYTYKYLSKYLSNILNEYYYLSDSKYIKTRNKMPDSDSTKLYCSLYLKPRNVVWVDFGFNIGCEFGGKHPAIIIKNINNKTLIVAPISTDKGDKQVSTDKIITFNSNEVYNMRSIRSRFTNITRITPVSVYRLDVNSTIGSIKKEKYNELIEKIKKYF